MADLVVVEYVCTGNNGRSPMMHMIAAEEVRRRGLIDRVRVLSSGVGRNTKFEPDAETLKRQRIERIDLGYRNGLFPVGYMREMAERVLSARANAGDDSVATCFEYLSATEELFRNMALQEAGLLPSRDMRFRRATEPRSDVSLVLTATADHAGMIKTVYGDSLFPQPPTFPIREYAREFGDLVNPFCSGLDVYRATRDELLRVVPLTIDRVAQELLVP